MPVLGGTTSGSASPLVDKGAWVTATAYVVNDVVTQAGQRYVCSTAHTAAAAFSTDFTATRWVALDPGASVPLATAAQTPAQEPVVTGATADVGTLAYAARADHIHPTVPTGAFGAIFGTSTTDVVFDGTTAVGGWNLSAGVYTIANIVSYRNVTVNAAATLRLNCVPLLISGTLTNNGTIQVNGGNAVGATGGAFPGNIIVYRSLTAPGGNGGTAVGGAGGGNNGGLGGIAGSAGAGASGAGGAFASNGAAFAQGRFWGTVPLLTRQTGFVYADNGYFGQINPGTGAPGGGGDTTNSGGGGGSGGGLLILCARTIVNAGTISANGGNGAAGTAGNTGGGGGGGGGVILITTLSYTNTGTVTVNGGTGGAASGTGTAGGAGNVGHIDIAICP